MVKRMMTPIFLLVFSMAVAGWLPILLLSSVALAKDDILANKLNLSLYGYVETSYTQNFNNPSSGVNNNRSFDGDANSFRPNMAQLVLEKAASPGGALADRAGFRLKLNFGEDAKFTGGTGHDDFDFQEAYVQYMPANNLTFQAGRMNTLIGYEVIESPLNPNFSRSFLFGIGEPFTVTGFRASVDFSESVSFAMSAINSFKGLQRDENNGKSIEALLSLAPTDNLGVSVFGFWGPEDSSFGEESADRMQVGGILDVQATDQLELVLEGYYGNQEVPGAANARWNGVAGYAIYDFNDQWGLHVRAEVFEDAAGYFSCFGDEDIGYAHVCPAGAAADQTLWETTWTLQYKPVPNLITRAEFRYDKSDRNTFDGSDGPTDSQSTLAGEMIFLF
ncbi:MAG: porin [Nitrospira sp.]|nr:porin [Nitrospira sp.]